MCCNQKLIERKMTGVEIVKEYHDLFQHEVPGLPPDQQVKFTIGVVPESHHVA